MKNKKALLLKKNKLLKELEQLESVIEDFKETEQKRIAELIIIHMDVLLEFAAEHDSNCSDKKAFNKDTCLRCALLNAQNDGVWDHNKYNFNISILDDDTDTVNKEEKNSDINTPSTEQPIIDIKKPIRGRKLSENQRKAIELGRIDKVKVLVMDEEAADLT